MNWYQLCDFKDVEQNEYKSVDELLHLRGKRWRVYFKMLSESAKHSGMFVQVPAHQQKMKVLNFQ